MGDALDFLVIPQQILDHMYVAWTLILLIVRYMGLLYACPGIGGDRGLLVRGPACFVLALASLSSRVYAPVPDSVVLLGAEVAAEFIFGLALGLIPLMIVSGVQTAGQIAASSMGLASAQLFDPTTASSVSDLSRLYGDLAVILFLVLGGHLVVLHAAAGLGGTIVPGTFAPGAISIGVLIDRSSDILRLGVMLSAPVVVALLLTQFVMGLISKAVPTVNIFVVSFPLTIGIGLILSVIALPEIVHILTGEMSSIDTIVETIARDAVQRAPVP